MTLQAVLCSGGLAAKTVRCTLPPATGASPDIIVGGQNTFVKLTSSNVAYNGGTGQFTFDVTVQNLIEQPMGTTDGTTLDPAGVRIFFHSGPTVTSGTGVASVLPDGFATFTSAGQAYYQYNQVLAQNATSSAKTWTLVMPPTVTTFSFLLFVSAPVEYPTGYITMDGQLPGATYGNLHPGDNHTVVGVAKTAVGIPTGAVVTFSTTNPLCATVDTNTGQVVGVRATSCAINATAGALSGTFYFDVTGTSRTWSGAVSTDWSVDGNWVGNLAPAAVDSAIIPTGTPNSPALVAATAIGGVTVADGAMLNLGTFDLTASANVTTGTTVGSGILGSTGALVLGGNSGTVQGRVPNLVVTSNASYSLSNDLYVVAPQRVDAGKIQSDLFNLQIVAQ